MTGRYTIRILPPAVQGMSPSLVPGCRTNVTLHIPGSIEIWTGSRVLLLRYDGTETPAVVGARIEHGLAFLEGQTDRMPACAMGYGASAIPESIFADPNPETWTGFER